MSKESKVLWHNWQEDVFFRAKSENKPILLSISALWCHWCHVMDEMCYQNQEIADYINSHYLAIRVDNDKRPDINRRYNMGGWPSTVFLNSHGQIITGATYIPPEQLQTLLVHVKEAYEKYAVELEEQGALRVGAGFEGAVELGGGRSVGNEEIHNYLDEQINSAYDTQWGGFGRQPKFPHTTVLRYLLEKARLRSEEVPDIVTFTLQQMAKGGIYDQMEGGFFRYSTTRDWTIPHYEKMAEDNAALLELYLWVYQWTGEDSYRQVALGIISFLEEKLKHEAGGFYGSQDADEEYYRAPAQRRAKLPQPPVDKTVYTNWSAALARAYLAGSMILQQPQLGDFALKTVRFLLSEGASPKGGVVHYLATAALEGQLVDQLELAEASLLCYSYSGDEFFLEKGRELVDLCLEKAWDEKEGGFWDQLEVGQLGALAQPVKSLDDNFLAARVLLLLGEITDQEQYRQSSKEIIHAFGSIYGQYGLFAAGMGLAALRLDPPQLIRIQGKQTDPNARELVNATFAQYHPWRLVTWQPKEAGAIAYPCLGTSCLEPISSPADLQAALDRELAGAEV